MLIHTSQAESNDNPCRPRICPQASKSVKASRAINM